MLDLEAAEDECSRVKHGIDRWAREPSSAAASKLIEQSIEYKGILTSANNSDKLVREKMRQFQPILDILTGPISGLEEYVPNSSRPEFTPKMDRNLSKLRSCLNEVSRLESRRQKKIDSLRQKVKADDISNHHWH